MWSSRVNDVAAGKVTRGNLEKSNGSCHSTGSCLTLAEQNDQTLIYRTNNANVGNPSRAGMRGLYLHVSALFSTTMSFQRHSI